MNDESTSYSEDSMHLGINRATSQLTSQNKSVGIVITSGFDINRYINMKRICPKCNASNDDHDDYDDNDDKYDDDDFDHFHY